MNKPLITITVSLSSEKPTINCCIYDMGNGNFTAFVNDKEIYTNYNYNDVLSILCLSISKYGEKNYL